MRGVHAIGAAGAIAVLALVADAHEPFQITTEARALPAGLALHVTLASRTATLACPAAVGAVRSLTAGDLTRSRAGLAACARSLYVIRSGGRALEPLTTELSLTEEGDFDVRLRYAAAAAGELTFDAVHLVRLSDPMYGAELTVTSERDFLGQALLRAASPVLTVHVPAGTTTPAVPPRPASALRRLLVLAALATLAVVAGLVWLLRRRA